MQIPRHIAFGCSCYLDTQAAPDKDQSAALWNMTRLCKLGLSQLSIMTCLPVAGDERPGQRAGDVVIVIDEKPHPLFKREGNDLHYTHRLPLADALCGPTMHVQTLDGRQLDVVMEGVAHPNAVKVVRGEGMPISKAPGTRGDLRIHFDIAFPKSLSPQQKTAIRANLPAR